jgi:hypothetical protein
MKVMKVRILSLIMIVMVVVLTGCEYDNFEPPKATLTGRIVYQSQTIGVRSPIVNSNGNSTTGGVQLELWQPGYAVLQKIPVYVNQDGTFSAALFNGDYKLTLLRGNGPWADRTDTINIQVKGSTVVDVPVDPFFIIKDETFQRDGTVINAKFNLQQIVASGQLERVSLYVGTTTIVDATNSAANVQLTASEIADLSQPVTLDLKLADNLAGRDYIFARVGVKTAGVSELLYSQVQKIQLR